jgi:hypothetical protein
VVTGHTTVAPPLFAQEFLLFGRPGPVLDPVLRLYQNSARTGRPITPEQLARARQQWEDQLQNRTIQPSDPEETFFGKVANWWDSLIQYLNILGGHGGDIDPVILLPPPCKDVVVCGA